MIPLPYKENKSYKKVCYICKKGFSFDDDNDNKRYCKVRDHCHFLKNIEELLIISVI